MSARKPYKRSMDGWWRKNPFFVEYMVHEGTAIFVALYGILLLVSVVRLSQGEAAWNQWAGFLTSPIAIFTHLAILVGFLYHAWTWFNIMPRTMPPIIKDGKRLPGSVITNAGLAAATVCSIVLFAIVWGLSK